MNPQPTTLNEVVHRGREMSEHPLKLSKMLKGSFLNYLEGYWNF